MEKGGVRDLNRIYRKELKYVISEEVYLQIHSRLNAVMQPDAHCRDGHYTVRSQYYDSLTDGDLSDNLDGVMEKRKIRVRIYSPDDMAAKLEYKCKADSDGIKYSLLLTKEEALMMEQHQYDFLLARKEELALRLYTKMTEQVYFPKTIVEYDRTAYLYPVSDVRITFDRNLRGSINPIGIYENNPAYVPLLGAGKGVLEIKYNDFFPSALKSLVASIDSVAQAYSKYAMSRLMFI